MSSQGPVTKKILLTLDLDMTLFDSRQKEATWMGGDEKFWLDTFDTVERIANRQGVEVLFSIVTSKTHFDDMCSVAAARLRKYLDKFNGKTYTTFQGKEHCFVLDNGSFKYESLVDNSTKPDLNIHNVATPFIIQRFADKPKFIAQLAKQHNIPLHQCVFLDDDWSNIRAAQRDGIQVVSYNWFNKLTPAKEPHIKSKLESNKNILFDMVGHIAYDIAASSAQFETQALNYALAAPFDSLFAPLYQTKESRLLNYVPGIQLDEAPAEESRLLKYVSNIQFDTPPAEESSRPLRQRYHT